MTDETRCTFEVGSSPRPLRCRHSDGHAGPHLFTFIPGMDGNESELSAEVTRLRTEISRLREALSRIVRGEEEAPVGMSSPAAVARAALESSP